MGGMRKAVWERWGRREAKRIKNDQAIPRKRNLIAKYMHKNPHPI